ncbi:MAG: ABC transporter permease [Spirochaetia bacterium]|nr:ABC transporter permease [Spirochaetia bacterium]
MILEHVRSAGQSLAGNKLRSALSMIGIVIGVASVVAVTTMGRSAADSITAQIAEAGLETIIVQPGRVTSATVERVFQENLADELALVSGVLEAAPVNQTYVYVKSANADARETVTSSTPGFVSIFSLELAEGRFLSQADMDSRGAVAVLGAELADTLFPDGGAVGSSIRFLGETPRQFKVVGVLEKKSDTYGFSFDSNIFVPRTSYLTRVAKAERVDRYVLRADADQDVLQTAERVEALMLDKLGSETAYRVMSPSTIAETATGVTDTLAGFLAGVAAISLLVGGIGIMNIMLVSVTERTKEIGVRKAIGATPSAIRMQFLVESAVITVSGGVLGLALGWGGSAIALTVLGWGFSASLPEALLAIGFSAGTGIFFGMYPAARAARLDPTVALSWE